MILDRKLFTLGFISLTILVVINTYEKSDLCVKKVEKKPKF